ncbi:MAG TPA: 23S rRNA (adenine(2503)-C(2))-methyltransferase RlmN, partial [Clostridiaceae bacterium]|nr:23S rRNA (adenine(2503)-C(2))-methyltransferase RlmN [Clostridiaceae bacterium]
LNDIKTWCADQGLEGYRADQIFAWQKKGLIDFEEMSDISKDTRLLLAQGFEPIPLKVSKEIASTQDGTKKYVLGLNDGNIVEAVLMRYRYGYSVCISTQVGCRMRCTFCASSALSFERNLSVGEMLAQVALINRINQGKVKRVTIMGIGEPFDNYSNLVEFLRRLNDPKGLNISLRRVTLSTCGIIDKMIKFVNECLYITLSISLHAPNQEIREELMPIAEKYQFSDLIEAGEYYRRESKRRITYEYALLAGINDQEKHALELATALRGRNCHVNIIPANEVPGFQFRPSSETTIQRFMQVLEHHGINVTRRRELGTDIAAACGQLRRSHEDA